MGGAGSGHSGQRITPITRHPLHLRCHAALLTAIAGGATAQTMSLWGGSLARFLPSAPVLCVAAVCGAGLAGLLCARALGRQGLWGWLLAGLAWPVITALGAALAVTPLGLMEFGLRSGGLVTAVIEAAALGWLAVGDGILTSPPVSAVWALGGIALHLALRAERAAT